MQRVNSQRIELEGKIAELESTLLSLRQRLDAVKALEQHEAVDHLEQCLEEVDSRYSNLKDFGWLLLSDIKKLFGRH